jgi:RNA polymerase sigma-70 factor (ECF subfamily)
VLVVGAAVTLRRLAGPMSAMPHPAGPAVPRGALDAEREARLIADLRSGDEAAFAALVRRHHAAMKRVARLYVATDAIAEEVVQETWLAAIAGLERFEQRATLKTWLFHILANKAKTRGARERRSVPFASLAPAEGEPSVAPERFQGANDAWPGHWAVPPRPWEDPERRLQSLEAREQLRAAIGALPEVQQAVLTLRDVEGLEAEEVCELLDLSDGNQRVILHRARARVRAELERWFEEAS